MKFEGKLSGDSIEVTVPDVDDDAPEEVEIEIAIQSEEFGERMGIELSAATAEAVELAIRAARLELAARKKARE